MSTDDLRRSWDATREHLAIARGELPHAANAMQELVMEFEHYLDHNELELAMDALVAAGEIGQPTAEFWRALSRAALNMGLADRADLFRRRTV